MSEPTAAPAAPDTGTQDATTAPAAPAAQAEPAAPNVDYAAEAAKWKALARRHEDAAKANAAAAKRLTEIEEAAKSDLQKATERAEAAEREAATLRTAHLRASIAAETAVPVDLITGDDEAAMRAAATRAVAWRDEAVTAATPGARLRVVDPAALRSGAAPGEAATGKERAAAALREMRTP